MTHFTGGVPDTGSVDGSLRKTVDTLKIAAETEAGQRGGRATYAVDVDSIRAILEAEKQLKRELAEANKRQLELTKRLDKLDTTFADKLDELITTMTDSFADLAKDIGKEIEKHKP